MKLKLLSWMGAWVCVLGLTAAGVAAELGGPAPQLSIADWIQGKPVDIKAGRGTNVYVVEFWATWCPPCRTTIPSLSALQEKYRDKGVIVVGVTDEPASKVKPFVKSMGSNMTYTVATDKNQQTSAAYLQAFGVNTIPHAFIVDKAGKIVWHGNPMAGLDQHLDQILAGTYNVDATRKSLKIQSLFQKYHMGAIAGQSATELTKVGEELLTEAAGMNQVLHQFAHIVLNEPRIVNRQVDLALKASKSVYDSIGDKQPVVAVTYSKALFDSGKVEEALKVARKGLAEATDQNSRNMLQAAVERYEKEAGDKK